MMIKILENIATYIIKIVGSIKFIKNFYCLSCLGDSG